MRYILIAIYTLVILVVLTACTHPMSEVLKPKANIVCPEPVRVILYAADAWWTETDEQQVSISMRRCAEKFGDESCLLRLVKTSDISYQAICGIPHKLDANTNGDIYNVESSITINSISRSNASIQ